MRILIITDSLGLPRPTPEIVPFENTWIELLRAELKHHKFDQISFGGATIDVLYNQYNYHKQFNADLVLLQCGIVDCAPRAFTKIENAILNSNKVFQWFFNKIISKRVINYFRRTRNIRKTPLVEFENILNKFNNDTSVFVPIEIVPGTNEYEKLVPGIKNSINIYNKKIAKYKNAICLSHFGKDYLMTDFHHLNIYGHKELAQIVKNKIFEHECQIK